MQAMMIAVLLLAVGVTGCTYFEVRGKGVTKVIGNTLEWDIPTTDVGWHVKIHRRGDEVVGLCPKGSSFKTQYGFVALHSVVMTMNGMNEHGLSISVHAYEGGATRPADQTTNFTVCVLDYTAYILGTFRSVEEVVARLPHVAVSSLSPQLAYQYAISDEKGSIVVDYMDNTLHIHNNTVGVMTNDPEYPWHLRNLGNYINLSPHRPEYPTSLLVDSEVGLVPEPHSHGQNLVGLPGDSTPPSRFVRTFFTREFAMYNHPPKTVDDSMVLATSILNTVHITKGTVAKNKGDTEWDYTQVSLIKVPALRHYLFRSYFDMSWKRIDLTKVDFSKSGSVPVGNGHMPIRDIFP